ncbi:MAG: hypothetical protein JO264_19955 [Acidisphaera sp.]|nr:hypothetical protein [Acidisphaera sp.]
MAMRALAVLAAVLLVGAFALATVLPPDLSLGQALSMLDRTLVGRLQALERAYLPGWVWTQITVSLLIRPAWLMPACLGVICGGAAATLASGGGTQRSRRRS